MNNKDSNEPVCERYGGTILLCDTTDTIDTFAKLCDSTDTI